MRARIPTNQEKLDLAVAALKATLERKMATAQELEYLLHRVDRARDWVEQEGPDMRRVHRIGQDSYH